MSRAVDTQAVPGIEHPDRYKWVVLSNTTLGSLMAMIETSIILIAVPDIFRGIHINPLEPDNSFYLLWIILSLLIVTSVFVVSLGRLGDAKPRSISKGASAATAVRWGAGSAVKSRFEALTKPATISTAIADRKRKVDIAKRFPA